jgi:uncharacterized membrane protein
MNKLIALTALLVAGVSAKADIIKCSFTEPFYTITYTTGTRVLTVTNDVENKTEVYKNIGLLILGSDKFELRTTKNELVMSLAITGNGSDGMSETIYPYDAKVEGMVKGANNGIGGCESLRLKRKAGTP